MTAKQLVQLPAYKELVNVAEAHEAISRSLIPFYTGIQTLKGLFPLARTAETNAKLDTTALTEVKQQLKMTLREGMLSLTTIVSAFAVAKKDVVFTKEMTSFLTKFGKTREDALVEYCTNILSTIRKHLLGLAEYGITEATLQEQEALIAELDDKVPQHRNTRNEKALSTKERNALFDKMEALVDEEIMKIAEGFKKQNRPFYDKLLAAVTFNVPKPVVTQIKLRFKNVTHSFLPQTLTAGVEGSTEPNKSANDKGEIIIKLDKGGLYPIAIFSDSNVLVKVHPVRVAHGRTKTIGVAI